MGEKEEEQEGRGGVRSGGGGVVVVELVAVVVSAAAATAAAIVCYLLLSELESFIESIHFCRVGDYAIAHLITSTNNSENKFQYLITLA